MFAYQFFSKTWRENSGGVKKLRRIFRLKLYIFLLYIYMWAAGGKSSPPLTGGGGKCIVFFVFLHSLVCSFIHSFIHLFIHFSIMCVIGRGRGGEGRNVGLIYSPPLHFFKPYHLLACVRWVMGGEGSVADGQILARGGELSQ